MNIKTSTSVTLRYNLKWSDGTDVDTRKQTGLAFVLTMPDDTTITITDLGYDKLNNQVWVNVDSSHTATTGTYKGNLSVFTSDLQMVTTGIVDLFTVATDGTDTNAVLALAVTAIETPVNDGQGYSPKIVNSEWYVYDDTKKSYVATGTPCGVTSAEFDELETELNAKVDEKVAELSEFSDDLSATKKEVFGVEQNYIEGYGVDKNSGSIVANSALASTNYISIANNSSVVWHYGGNTIYDGYGLCFYDEEKTFIDSWRMSSASERTFDIPDKYKATAKYIRATMLTEYISESYIKVDGVKVWEPIEGYEGLDQKIETKTDKSDVEEIIKKHDSEEYTASFTGNDSSYVSGTDLTELKGKSYRVIPLEKSWDWGTTADAYYILELVFRKEGDTSSTDLIGVHYRDVKDGGKLADYYDITIPNDAVYVSIGGRAAKGLEVDFTIQELSKAKEKEWEEKYYLWYLKFPSEISQLENVFGKKNSFYRNSLKFIHTSDNHGEKMASGIYDISSLADVSDAKFIANTGDLISSKYSDSYDTIKAQILSMEKPCYVIMGNHDCYQSPSLSARYSKFIEPLNEHNGLDTANTYYSVDYADEMVKCIYLDLYDGVDDYSSYTTMRDITQGHMSKSQINWFANQLKDAISNDYHVAIFCHTPPSGGITKVNDVWYEYEEEDETFLNVQFLEDIVDAFMNGETVSFSYNGSDYSFTFASAGAFIAWFSGHTHYDKVGWLKRYPSQISVAVKRPYCHQGMAQFTVIDSGATCNYVYINTQARQLSITRLGDDDTYYGKKKECLYFKY